MGENVGAVIYVRDRTDRACIPWFEKVEWRGAREPVRHLRTLAALLENTALFSASIYASSSTASNVLFSPPQAPATHVAHRQARRQNTQTHQIRRTKAKLKKIDTKTF